MPKSDAAEVEMTRDPAALGEEIRSGQRQLDSVQQADPLGEQRLPEAERHHASPGDIVAGLLEGLIRLRPSLDRAVIAVVGLRELGAGRREVERRLDKTSAGTCGWSRIELPAPSVRRALPRC